MEAVASLTDCHVFVRCRLLWASALSIGTRLLTHCPLYEVQHAVRGALDRLNLVEETRAAQVIARQVGEYRAPPFRQFHDRCPSVLVRFGLPERARSIQKQPIIGGGMFGGISARHSHETAEIPDLFLTISVPSRGANKINYLRLFPHNLI